MVSSEHMLRQSNAVELPAEGTGAVMLSMVFFAIPAVVAVALVAMTLAIRPK